MRVLINKIKNIKSPFKKTLIMYTAVWLVVMLVSFGHVLVLGMPIVEAKGDTYRQHLILIDFLRQFTSQNGFHLLNSWSWNMGLGTDVINAEVYYHLGDVWGWLNSLVSIKYQEFVYSLFYLFRVYLIGFSFLIFAKRYVKSVSALTAASIVVAFNSFVVLVYHPMFLDLMILMGMALFAIDKLIFEKKQIPLLLVYGYAFVSNVYTAYILGISTGIYFLVTTLMTQRKSRDILATIWRYAVAGIIALLIAAPFVVQMVRSILQSARNGGSLANGLRYWPISYFMQIPHDIFTYSFGTGYFVIGTSIVAVFGIIYAVKNLHEYSRALILLVIGLSLYLFPQTTAVMNGFTSASGRWGMIMIFVFGMFVAIALEKFPYTEKKTWKWSIAIFTFISFLSYLRLPISFNRPENILNILIGIIILAIWWINQSAMTKFPATKAMAVVTILGVMVLIIPMFGTSGVLGWFTSKNIANWKPYSVFNAQANKNQRVQFTASSDLNSVLDYANFAYRNDVMSPEIYNSLENGNISQFSKMMLNNQDNKVDQLQQDDNREELWNFLGIRQVASRNGNKTLPFLTYKNSKGSAVYTTDSEFPLLYGTDTVISEATFDRLAPWKRSAFLSYGVVDGNSDNTDVPKMNNVIDFGAIGNAGYLKFTHNKPSVTFELPKDNSNMELLLYINGLSYKSSPMHLAASNEQGMRVPSRSQLMINKLNEELPRLPDDKYTVNIRTNTGYEAMPLIQPSKLSTTMYKHVDEAMVNLGASKVNRTTVTLTSNDYGLLNYSDMRVVGLKFDDAYKKRIFNMRANGAKNLKLTNSGLTAKFNNRKKMIIGSSIPYVERGWTLKIDNKKTPIFKSNLGFVGFKMPAGKHDVELKYKTPYVRESIFISLIGIVSLVIVLIVNKKENKRLLKSGKITKK